MKHWQKMSGALIVRAALSCSLLVTLAFAGPYSDLRANLRATKDATAKKAAMSDLAAADQALRQAIKQGGVARAEEYIDLKAFMEGDSSSALPAVDAKAIKNSPLYSDGGDKVEQNWLANAAARLRKLFEHDDIDAPKFNAPNIGAPTWLVPFAWFILGAILVGFLAYSLRFIKINKAKKRQARTMMEDDEPERTLDEWLAMADQFEREGRFREAVRALYLACLLKFDERNIARFMRGQTNWEHLARIESSARKPAGLDFRTPTKAFDQIWYGNKIRGAEDVADFRTWYQQVKDSLLGAAA